MSASDFAQDGRKTIVCGGTARLPHASAVGSAMLMVELEMDPHSQSVLAVHVNPELQGLKRLLESAIVGHSVAEVPMIGVQAIKERYLSPFRNAARAALLHAWEAFAQFEKKAPAEIPDNLG